MKEIHRVRVKHVGRWISGWRNKSCSKHLLKSFEEFQKLKSGSGITLRSLEIGQKINLKWMKIPQTGFLVHEEKLITESLNIQTDQNRIK